MYVFSSLQHISQASTVVFRDSWRWMWPLYEWRGLVNVFTSTVYFQLSWLSAIGEDKFTNSSIWITKFAMVTLFFFFFFFFFCFFVVFFFVFLLALQLISAYSSSRLRDQWIQIQTYTEVNPRSRFRRLSDFGIVGTAWQDLYLSIFPVYINLWEKKIPNR